MQVPHLQLELEVAWSKARFKLTSPKKVYGENGSFLMQSFSSLPLPAKLCYFFTANYFLRNFKASLQKNLWKLRSKWWQMTGFLTRPNFWSNDKSFINYFFFVEPGLFSFFPNTNFTEKTVGFSVIQTQIARLECCFLGKSHSFQGLSHVTVNNNRQARWPLDHGPSILTYV